MKTNQPRLVLLHSRKNADHGQSEQTKTSQAEFCGIYLTSGVFHEKLHLDVKTHARSLIHYRSGRCKRRLRLPMLKWTKRPSLQQHLGPSTYLSPAGLPNCAPLCCANSGAAITTTWHAELLATTSSKSEHQPIRMATHLPLNRETQ